MPRSKREAENQLAITSIRQTQREGREAQLARAQIGPPPRAVLRAVPNMNKTGRRGRKARARVLRLASKYGVRLK